MGSGFRHEGLIYAGEEEFLARAVPFVAGAVEVRFAAIEELACNPARVVPFWRDFLDEHEGGPVSGAGGTRVAGTQPA